VGLKASAATNLLPQNSIPFKVKNMSGGMLSLAHNYMLDFKERG
jgi:hypothetical protein